MIEAVGRVLDTVTPGKLGVVPFAATLVDWNLRFSYGPLDRVLGSRVAPWVPRSVSPNAVTLASTALLLPVLFALSRRHCLLAAALVVLHDLLDRLDGSLARYRRDPSHDGRLGAFLDAQGDKVFHVGFLLFCLRCCPSSWAYVVVAWAVIVAQSVSFVVRSLDYYFPVPAAKSGAAPDLRAGGDGKLATTLCNAAAAVACLAAGPGGPRAGAWAVVLLIVSLDLALRSVKNKLTWRVSRGGAVATPEGSDDDEVFLLAAWLQSLHAVVAWPTIAQSLVSRLTLPGMATFLGTRTALVFQIQGAAMLLALPFLFCVKHELVWGCLVVVLLFNVLMELSCRIAAHHYSQKAITYVLFSQTRFVEYASVRVFGLVCLWSLWTHSGADWSWLDYLIVNAVLAAHFVYTIALLLIRFDDTMPQHPALVASWARVGGNGVASGTSAVGVLRDRLRPVALMLMVGTLGSGSGSHGHLFAQWHAVAAIAAFVALCVMNHLDLSHKLRVRGVAHKLSRTTVETLAPQDPELQADRSDNPPPYDVVVTIGCFDLFHDGHVKLMQRMRSHGKRLLVGLHDDESINLLKGRFPVDNVVKRLRNVKRYADVVFVIPSTDPSPYLDAAVDRAVPKHRMCFIRGADMPQFPGRVIAEQLMDIKLTPYTEGVSSTMLRAKLTERVDGDSYALSGGTMIWFHDSWINTASEPIGTGWIPYGLDFYRYRTSESSPTIW